MNSDLLRTLDAPWSICKLACHESLDFARDRELVERQVIRCPFDAFALDGLDALLLRAAQN